MPILRRHVLASVALPLCAGIVLTSCGGNDATTVRTVWYGTSADGPVAGTTPVRISASMTPGRAFLLDLGGFAAAGTDAQWDAAARTGAISAMLALGEDPRGHSLSFSVPESIGGPSAGALLTVGSMAALQGVPLADDVTMTGTIFPDGSIGEVTGIPDKMRAARDAGLTTLAYPAGVTRSVDTATGAERDIDAYARELGITAVPVASVAQALPLFAGDAFARPQADPPTVAQALVDLVAEAATATVARLADPGLTVAPAVTGTAEDRNDVQLGVTEALSLAPQQLASGLTFEALATASLAERDVARWNAAQAAAAATSTNGAQNATALLLDQIRAATETTAQARARAAATPTRSAEQLVALPDALGWATDALATLRVTSGLLGAAVPTVEVLASQAADVAQVRYDVEHFLPLAVRAVQATPGNPMVDAAVSRAVVADYAELLADSARANVDYYRALGDDLGADAQLPDPALAEALAFDLATVPAGDASPAAALAERTSAALSFWVQSTALVANAGTVSAGSRSVDDGTRLRIDDAAAFARRLAVAAEGNMAQARVLSAADLNPSYLTWGTRWGAALAGDAERIDSAQLEGLVYVWYAGVTGRMLSAVGAG